MLHETIAMGILVSMFIQIIVNLVAICLLNAAVGSCSSCSCTVTKKSSTLFGNETLAKILGESKMMMIIRHSIVDDEESFTIRKRKCSSHFRIRIRIRIINTFIICSLFRKQFSKRTKFQDMYGKKRIKIVCAIET